MSKIQERIEELHTLIEAANLEIKALQKSCPHNKVKVSYDKTVTHVIGICYECGYAHKSLYTT